jgi:hypothetical protein
MQTAFFVFEKTWFPRWNEKAATDVANATAASEAQKSEGSNGGDARGGGRENGEAEKGQEKKEMMHALVLSTHAC